MNTLYAILDNLIRDLIAKILKGEGTRNMMIESAALFAGMNALMAALQVLQRERDYRLAKKAFEQQYKQSLTEPNTVKAAIALESIAPPEVIKKLLENAKKCWDHWLEYEHEALMPGQEREADKAVKSCVCRQLKRIMDLNGSLPDEWKKQWDRYGCAKT